MLRRLVIGFRRPLQHRPDTHMIRIKLHFLALSIQSHLPSQLLVFPLLSYVLPSHSITSHLVQPRNNPLDEESLSAADRGKLSNSA